LGFLNNNIQKKGKIVRIGQLETNFILRPLHVHTLYYAIMFSKTKCLSHWLKKTVFLIAYSLPAVVLFMPSFYYYVERITHHVKKIIDMNYLLTVVRVRKWGYFLCICKYITLSVYFFYLIKCLPIYTIRIEPISEVSEWPRFITKFPSQWASQNT